MSNETHISRPSTYLAHLDPQRREMLKTSELVGVILNID